MPCDGAATHIQARIKGDNTIIVSASDRLSVGPKYGLLCKTSEQYDNKCLNYRVSYLLPKRKCHHKHIDIRLFTWVLKDMFYNGTMKALK